MLVYHEIYFTTLNIFFNQILETKLEMTCIFLMLLSWKSTSK